MKLGSTVLAAGLTVAAAGTPLHAAAPASQSPEPQAIRTALLPLAAPQREAAAVYEITPNGEMRELRAGTNGLFCLLDPPGDDQLMLQCHPLSMAPFIHRQLVLQASLDWSDTRARLAEEVGSGELAIPLGATSYVISGGLGPQTGEPRLVKVWAEIAMPFLAAERTGLPATNVGEQLWIHHPGEYNSHIMVGYRQVPWAEVLKQE